MMRLLAFLYGLVNYLLFLGVFLYAMGFVESMVVPKGMNDVVWQEETPVKTAVLINVLLLGIFGIQHSVMARPEFKAVWCKLVPVPIERSTFVLFTNVVFALLFWQWRAMPEIVWQIDHSLFCAILIGISFAGWGLVLYSTFVIDHFGLFGLKQVYLYLRGQETSDPPFVIKTVYSMVRHPLMTGFIIAFWAAPTMTQGHLLFAVVTTVYILVAIQIEERDLKRFIGDPYVQYAKRTPMIIPIPKRARVNA